MFQRKNLWSRLGLSLSLVLLLTLFSAAFIAPAPTTRAASPAPGTIYYGATPSNAATKPVLVFVHGYNSDGTVWYTNNDMFSYAYNAGFRAVAVSLYPGGSIWANGQLLASLIQQICAHYNVPTVNIVAHSKGGVDTQAAVVFYGAGPQVQNVVTLDSPHEGTQLADLDYSWWAGWLGAIFGQHSDATYDLQTSYMSYFRSITDGNSNNNYIHLYTTDGTYNLSPAAYFFGGLYLDQYDSNDGVVPVYSTFNPEGTGIYSFNYNHHDVTIGHNSFQVIQPYISSNWRSGTALTPRTVSAPKAISTPAPTSDQILRGGKMRPNSTQTENIQVEAGVGNLKFELLTENAKLKATAIGPNGERVALQFQADKSAADQYFAGAQHLEATILKPSAGVWHIQLDTRKSGAASYLLLSNLKSGLKLNLALTSGSTSNTSQTIYQPGSWLNLNLTGFDNKGQSLHNLHVEGVALQKGDRTNLNTDKSVSVRIAGDTSASNSYRLPQQEGVYNLSLTVTGNTADGQAFERSLTTSVLVGTPASLATHAPTLEGN